MMARWQGSRTWWHTVSVTSTRELAWRQPEPRIGPPPGEDQAARPLHDDVPSLAELPGDDLEPSPRPRPRSSQPRRLGYRPASRLGGGHRRWRIAALIVAARPTGQLQHGPVISKPISTKGPVAAAGPAMSAARRRPPRWRREARRWPPGRYPAAG